MPAFYTVSHFDNLSQFTLFEINNICYQNEVIDELSTEVINELFEKVSKEKERDFPLKGKDFKFYITKTLKEGNRKNNYLYYCANNRTVGNPKNIKNINSIFSYPIFIDNKYYFFDIYVVSDFLNKKVFNTRNGFNISKEKENLLFNDDKTITFQDIEEQISSILEGEYDSFVKTAKQRNIDSVKSYISQKAPRLESNSFRNIF